MSSIPGDILVCGYSYIHVCPPQHFDFLYKNSNTTVHVRPSTKFTVEVEKDGTFPFLDTLL